jgi:hypothetical protein
MMLIKYTTEICDKIWFDIHLDENDLQFNRLSLAILINNLNVDGVFIKTSGMPRFAFHPLGGCDSFL